MEVKIYRTISDVKEAEWDEIVDPDKIFCTHGFTSAVERSGFNKVCYYPVLYEDGRIVAHASVYFFRTELDLFTRGP